MANNTNLGAAKAAKNDEFYTQYADIQKEINAYLEYNPDTFRDKVVLLPCDDPEWSNFTRFFAHHTVPVPLLFLPAVFDSKRNRDLTASISY